MELTTPGNIRPVPRIQEARAVLLSAPDEGTDRMDITFTGFRGGEPRRVVIREAHLAALIRATGLPLRNRQGEVQGSLDTDTFAIHLRSGMLTQPVILLPDRADEITHPGLLDLLRGLLDLVDLVDEEASGSGQVVWGPVDAAGANA